MQVKRARCQGANLTSILAALSGPDPKDPGFAGGYLPQAINRRARELSGKIFGEPKPKPLSPLHQCLYESPKGCPRSYCQGGMRCEWNDGLRLRVLERVTKR